MTESIRNRAIKCLLEQSGYAHPTDPAINFRMAFIVKNEIYLTQDAAERATHEYKPAAHIEVISYTEAYQTKYPQIEE